MPTTKTKKPTQINAAEPKPPAAMPAPSSVQAEFQKLNAKLDEAIEQLRPKIPPVAPNQPAKSKLSPMLDLTANEYEELCGYLPIIQGNHGCTTPAEQFITGLVYAHVEHHALTVEDVEGDFETFIRDYEDMDRDSAVFGRQPIEKAEKGPALPPADCCFLDLSEYDYQGLCRYLAIVRADYGFTSPIEEFIVHLVIQHRHRPLSPETIKPLIEQLREDFEDLAGIVKYANSKYPELGNPEPAAA